MDTARYIEKDDLKQTSAGRGAAILENKTKKCTGILFNRRCEEVEIDLGYSRPTEEGSDEYLIFSLIKYVNGKVVDSCWQHSNY
ncbi:MAG: hypothetical protein A2451_13850 [Bdellovibrionales bacterium RIFOXYC2_FULL_39_8]|nr:MAG: hypothetical protein A2451_13850 [Bdellovibrionales bacterium RIFOXYC2_FULL_39_8]